MKVKGLDGKEYSWTLKSSDLSDSGRSKLHLMARQLIQEMFPYDIIYEDVTLPGSKRMGRKSLLYADIFIPNRKILIEVNGRQHSEHVSFFHKTKFDFLKAAARDRDKKEWCEINDIILISLDYSESVEDWRIKINDR